MRQAVLEGFARRVAVAVVLAGSVALAGGAKATKEAVKHVVLAAEPTVSVQADVVFASQAKGTVDPSLAEMQKTLATKVNYQTLKKLSTRTLVLTAKAQPLELPNKKTAVLSLESLKKDEATEHLELPPTRATYTLARDKSLYVQAGDHESGQLWLVLSQPK